MCGICGYVGDHRPEVLEPMCSAMIHRGPDDAGTWTHAEQQVGLGHRRLSIIDLSPAGHQPMCNEDGTVWISFNGEIYNFQELREGLVARGHAFRGRSDTEVMVHLYEEAGPDFVKRLNGIFALAVWDMRERRLLLARDHAGIKPLYYWRDARRLFFASEIKALLRVPGVPRELYEPAVSHFLTFLWVPGEHTLLRGIQKLEPGHLLTWQDGRIETRRWFDLAYEPDDSVPEDQWVERVHDTFMRTTRRQMVSDVPLGAFLSGGTDSSAIVACMRHSFPERKIKCYTVRMRREDMGREGFVDDYPYATEVARILNVELESVEMEPGVISLLPKMVYHLDEPDADPAVIPNYLISRLAREDGTTVLLSGTGGDEVFFGYRSHQAQRQYQRMNWIPRRVAGPALAAATAAGSATMGAQSAVARRLRKFRRGFMASGLERQHLMADWSSPATRESLYLPEFLARVPDHDAVPDCLRRYFEGFQGRGALNRHSHVLIQTFLAAHNFLYTDKSSMATSIEVRVPFLDVELMKLCATIPEQVKLKGNVTKYPLKKAMERYIPRSILHRSKSGFGGPLRKWIAEDLDPVIHDLLSPAQLRARGLFKHEAIATMIEENRANRADHAYLIYALLTMEIWQRTFLDRPAEELTL
jgi:asparagine synthase (glutamine-hydrolysing)